jgi:hypothetical protein
MKVCCPGSDLTIVCPGSLRWWRVIERAANVGRDIRSRVFTRAERAFIDIESRTNQDWGACSMQSPASTTGRPTWRLLGGIREG